MNEPRPRKPQKKRVPKFGEKRKRPNSWGTPPYTPKGQLALDFENGDLTPEQLAVFA